MIVKNRGQMYIILATMLCDGSKKGHVRPREEKKKIFNVSDIAV